MKIIVISMQNGLLSGAIAKYLCERGEMMPERVLNHSRKDEPCSTCKSLGASVLLMDTSRIPPFTLENRLETAKNVRRQIPGCKIALLCDDSADPETAERVKNAKKMGLIDGFFHSSVTGEYLAAALDTL